MGLFKKTTVGKDFVNLVRANDNGEEWAENKLGELWNNNQISTRDLCEARVVIYEAPAKRGDKEARYWMGKSLQVLDPPSSFQWLLDLAREGDVRAMKTLGLGFSTVSYYGEDPEKELYWYLEAAKVGDAEAQYMVGREYYGKALESHKNPEQAKIYFESTREWLEKSAKQGYPQGVLKLAELFIQLGNNCKNEVYKKYHFDFNNQAMQEELQKAKETSLAFYDKADDLLTAILKGEYEECYDGDIAKAFDIRGDMINRNLFEDEEPEYEFAVQCYYLATLLDDEEVLISKKKMNDVITQHNLNILREQFDAWKREALDGEET